MAADCCPVELECLAAELITVRQLRVRQSRGTRVSGRHAGLVIAAVVVAAALAPGTAPARSSACSVASKANGSKIVARSEVAVVFSRRGERSLLGCTYGGPVFKLNAICCEVEQARLAGRFFAYTYTTTAIGDESSRLGVYDLKRRKREKVANVRELDTGSFVTQLAVTSRGSLVWLINGQREEGADPPELWAADGPARKKRIVDSGNLDLKSLKISRDEKTILYRKGGAAMSVPLLGGSDAAGKPNEGTLLISQLRPLPGDGVERGIVHLRVDPPGLDCDETGRCSLLTAIVVGLAVDRSDPSGETYRAYGLYLSRRACRAIARSPRSPGLVATLTGADSAAVQFDNDILGRDNYEIPRIKRSVLRATKSVVLSTPDQSGRLEPRACGSAAIV